MRTGGRTSDDLRSSIFDLRSSILDPDRSRFGSMIWSEATIDDRSGSVVGLTVVGPLVLR
jgi:hypothetical protein